MNPDNPLIAQPDLSILLEVNNKHFKAAREAISFFLELVKSPKLFYTYSLNETSLWNGLSTGLSADEMIASLERFAKFPLPETVKRFIQDNSYHYGIFKLKAYDEHTLLVCCKEEDLLTDLSRQKAIRPFVMDYPATGGFTILRLVQGVFKSEMIKLNFPVEDLVGFQAGDPMPVAIKKQSGFKFRTYQIEAAETFLGKDKKDGAGVVVLPCGAGKTAVGIYILTALKMNTLIVVPNIVALRQWKKEVLAITDLHEDLIGEYSGEKKEIKPLTLVTYQILIYRKNKDEAFKHFDLFFQKNWGLIIYDEIHILPAPIFRSIASIQSKRRLGLTATLIREDNKEREVFALVGPKKYDMPWKDLEELSFIANACCYEIKVPLTSSRYHQYFKKSQRGRFRLASENEEKLIALDRLLEFFPTAPMLIIGQYLDQLASISRRFDIPLVTGKTTNEERQRIYSDFILGKLKRLTVSKVANFAIDLPNASVAIQVSGTYGSRQEEAQRLGRILRPKEGDNRAYFFNLVSTDTQEEVFAQNRRRFLMEQGYQYKELSMNAIKNIETFIAN